jgi:hypothetical protein
MKSAKHFFRKIIMGFKRWLAPGESEEVKPVAPPMAAQPVIAPTIPGPLHLPLVTALGGFAQGQLRVGQIIFHGCSATAPHINVVGRCFLGTRKWFSSNAIYAADYGRSYGAANGDGLLWVCQVKAIIPALIGSQSSLMPSSPWANQFPWMFPDQFGRYANHVMNGNGPSALLDFPEAIGYGEILIAHPQLVLDVLHICSVPTAKAQSDRFGRRVNAVYVNFR